MELGNCSIGKVASKCRQRGGLTNPKILLISYVDDPLLFPSHLDTPLDRNDGFRIPRGLHCSLVPPLKAKISQRVFCFVIKVEFFECKILIFLHFSSFCLLPFIIETSNPRPGLKRILYLAHVHDAPQGNGEKLNISLAEQSLTIKSAVA